MNTSKVEREHPAHTVPFDHGVWCASADGTRGCRLRVSKNITVGTLKAKILKTQLLPEKGGQYAWPLEQVRGGRKRARASVQRAGGHSALLVHVVRCRF